MTSSPPKSRRPVSEGARNYGPWVTAQEAADALARANAALPSIYDFIGQPATITSSTVHLVGVPLCPDLLTYAEIGQADGLRGRVIRGFFWLMQVW